MIRFYVRHISEGHDTYMLFTVSTYIVAVAIKLRLLPLAIFFDFSVWGI